MKTSVREGKLLSRVFWGLMVVAGSGLGGRLAGLEGALVGGLLCALGAILREHLEWERDVRRRRALAQLFPKGSRAFLEGHCDLYLRLSSKLRSRFEHDLRIFLAETRITGVEVEATEELRLLVAASAVTLSLGWPDFEWDHVSEVLLYPRAFDRDYSFKKPELIGQAHQWGTVILSVPALRRSFEVPHDGHNVGLHEFAHLLSLDHGDFGGIPVGMARRWADLVVEEMERLREGQSLLDPYGGLNSMEFFAVSVEVFFEQPQALRRRHRELYESLSRYFCQDPAAWDDARGLTL